MEIQPSLEEHKHGFDMRRKRDRKHGTIESAYEANP